MRILIIDDSAFMRGMIKATLADGNHEMKEAGNAEEAVTAFNELKPELVFLDVILPDKNGVEILRELKAIDNSVNVVMCTSVGGQQNIIDEAIESGAADIITKPFKKEDILKIVENLSMK